MGSHMVRTHSPLPRRPCVAVRVGPITVGGGAPVVVQSMTNTDTADVDATTRQVADEISRNTGVDDIILAPPHYAFLAQRRIAEDYSELFLWYLKYLNERQDRQHGRGVQVVERIAELLRERRIAFVLLDLNQTGKIPEIRAAIEENYMPLRSTELQTLNTRLQFYKPKSLSRLPRM